MTSEELKQSLPMRAVIENYGIGIDKKGFCCCPFHREKTASMKIFKESYYCFGCGEAGDIFSFVQKKENVDFKTAFKQLGGSYRASSDFQHNLYQYKMNKRKETEKARLHALKVEKHVVSEEIKLQKIFIMLFEVFSDEWCEAKNRLEYLFYRLECITEKR